jgi:iron complex outermembrane receptor protein
VVAVGGRNITAFALPDEAAGFKSKLLDRFMTLNVAAYYSDFKGYQVNQVINTRDADGNVIVSQVSVHNAKRAPS